MSFWENKKTRRVLTWWGIGALVAVLLVIKLMAPAPVANAPVADNAPVVAEQQAAEISGPAYNDESIMAVLWARTAPEYRELCYQAYNLALERVKAAVMADALNVNKDKKPLAIVLDSDETVLDTMDFQASFIGRDGERNSDKNWDEWCVLKKSKAMPGAVDYLNAVDNLGVSIFYVTNRRRDPETTRESYEGSINNMRELGLPQIDDEHVLFLSDGGAKQPRFDRVTASFDVIIYMGDSLTDLPLDVSGKNSSERRAVVDANKDDFGRKFIVFPNPTYGGWESSLASGYSKLSMTERDKIRREALASK